MEIKKSTRHSKITGNFGENLVLYLLSKYGFESANVDHTGIDIISRNFITNEVMGISVKSRSRAGGTEGSYISIPNDNFDKVQEACKAFNCVPYFAIVSDEKDKMYVFILSMKHLLKLFPKGEKICAWKMTDKHVEKYLIDKEIFVFEFNYKNHNWWGNSEL
jgi:Holliday junction resolvase-like predicted endonuclease